MLICSYDDTICKYEFTVFQNKEYESILSCHLKYYGPYKLQNNYHNTCASNIWSHMLSTTTITVLPLDITIWFLHSSYHLFLSAYNSITRWDSLWLRPKNSFESLQWMLQNATLSLIYLQHNFLLKSHGMLNVLRERWRWRRGMEE